MCTQIISGGQTGADRAGLDWAIKHSTPHRGWCPKGRKAEDGTIPERYHLTETPSRDYRDRTERNVNDADATIIFTAEAGLDGGSLLTAKFAQKNNKKWIHLPMSAGVAVAVERMKEFLASGEFRALNIAGSRASKGPGIERFVDQVLEETLCLDPHSTEGATRTL